MKKISLFILSVLYTLASFAAIEGVNKMYVVGNATDAGWDNKKAIQMVKQEDGNFKWVLDMKAGEFKFLVNNTNWENFISCNSDNDAPGNVDATIGEAMPVSYYPEKAPKDFKWVLKEAGRYTLYVNVADETLLVTEGGDLMDPPTEEKADYSSCCLVGSATEAGWTPQNAVPMTLINDGYFIWTGTLKAGELKFLNAPAENFDAHICPVDDVRDFELTGDYTSKDFADTPYDLTFKGNDKKFFIKNEGTYTVCVNLKTMQAIITKAVNELESVFINGGSTHESGEWKYVDYPFEAVADQPGVFTWTGDLYAPDKQTEFKFRTAENWSRVLVAYTGDVVVSKGNTYPLSYIPVNGMPNNNNFKLAETGKYKLTIDLNTLTLKVEEGEDIGTGNTLVDVSDYSVLAIDRAVSIVADGLNVESAAIYDITGKCLNSMANMEGRFVLANELSNGVYVVKMIVDGKESVQKVLVK